MSFPGRDFSQDVDAALTQFAEQRRQDLADLGPDAAELITLAVESTLGGKHLRPAFCLAGWLAAGRLADDPRAIRVAAALEWLQASALVHDDLMDQSDVRRGAPSAHRRMERRHRDSGWSGAAEHFGMSAAVLLGDLLLSWCDDAIRASGFDAETLLRAGRYLDAAKSEVVAGQYLDIVQQARGTVTLDEALRVVRFKAAKYTVERPLHIGAALGGADDTLIGALSAVGIPLGEAFQLRDDVLGVFGDPARTGKPAGDDIREGKRTALIACAHDRAGTHDRAVIDRVLGDTQAPDGAVAEIAEIIVRTGALGTVEDLIASRSAAATTAIGDIGNDPARAALTTLLRATTQRDR